MHLSFAGTGYSRDSVGFVYNGKKGTSQLSISTDIVAYPFSRDLPTPGIKPGLHKLWYICLL